jgi:SAM-dependent methyltransferase
MRLLPRVRLIEARRFQPPLPLPAGKDLGRILDSLVSVSIENSPRGELRDYAKGECERFLHTLALVSPDAGGRLLEIGANPYFTTLLLRRFRPALELSLVNFFGAGAGDGRQQVEFENFEGQSERVAFDYRNANVEDAPLPFPDAHFDHVLFCEVLEHLTLDPLRAVRELKRVLKPGGSLVLTTPNAARLENLIAFAEGRNIYDLYSGHGAYGRHNREYTKSELHALMEHAGFDNDTSYTASVHDDVLTPQTRPAAINRLIARHPGREATLGQYLMTRWTNARPGSEKLPQWLYRSYAAQDMAPA